MFGFHQFFFQCKSPRISISVFGCREECVLEMLSKCCSLYFSALSCKKGLLGLDPKEREKDKEKCLWRKDAKSSTLTIMQLITSLSKFPVDHPRKFLHFAWEELLNSAQNSSWLYCLPRSNTGGCDNHHTRKKQSLDTESSDMANLDQDSYRNWTNRGSLDLGLWLTAVLCSHVCADASVYEGSYWSNPWLLMPHVQIHSKPPVAAQDQEYHHWAHPLLSVYIPAIDWVLSRLESHKKLEWKVLPSSSPCHLTSLACPNTVCCILGQPSLHCVWQL